MSDLPGVVAEQPTDYSRDSWLTDAGEIEVEVVRNAQTTVGGLGSRSAAASKVGTLSPNPMGFLECLRYTHSLKHLRWGNTPEAPRSVLRSTTTTIRLRYDYDFITLGRNWIDRSNSTKLEHRNSKTMTNTPPIRATRFCNGSRACSWTKRTVFIQIDHVALDSTAYQSRSVHVYFPLRFPHQPFFSGTLPFTIAAKSPMSRVPNRIVEVWAWPLVPAFV